jgi:hypothetical protein
MTDGKDIAQAVVASSSVPAKIKPKKPDTRTAAGRKKLAKSKGGKPLKFPSVKALQDKINEYFDVTPDDEILITGLAYHLETTRETLMEYEARDEYADTIKRAKLRVQMEYEKSLRKNGRAGDIFGLKNFGWKDKTEVDMNATVSMSDTLADMEELD